MNSPELTQAIDEPKIKASSSSGYLYDQSLESQAKRIALCWIFVGLDGSEWVLGVRVGFF